MFHCDYFLFLAIILVLVILISDNPILYSPGSRRNSRVLIIADQRVTYFYQPVLYENPQALNASWELRCNTNIWVRSPEHWIPASIYLLKVNNRNIRARFAKCSKLTIKTSERRHWKFNKTKNVEKMVPLKYLSNFWRTLETPLINYEINHILTWSDKCVLSNDTKTIIFVLTYTKHYVPVVTLST